MSLFHSFSLSGVWRLGLFCSALMGLASGAHAAGSALDQREWRLIETNNEETSGTPPSLARYAFDGNANTFWRTRWRTSASKSDHPHYLIIDLGKLYVLDSLKVLPRQDSSNGRIRAFEFYVAPTLAALQSGQGLALTGNLANSKAEQTLAFPPRTGRYVKWVALSEHDEKTPATTEDFDTALAELNILGTPMITAATPGVVLYKDFSDEPLGAYNVAILRDRWSPAEPRTLRTQSKTQQYRRLSVITEEGTANKLWRMVYPAGAQGTQQGVFFDVGLPRATEYYVAFRLKLAQDFDFVKGGRLPGILGHAEGSTYDSICTRPEPNSWMLTHAAFAEAGTMRNKAHFATAAGACGDSLGWNIGTGTDYTLQRDRWYTIELRTKLNTVGRRDGILQAWVDGVSVFERQGRVFRTSEDLQLDTFRFWTMFSGRDSSAAPNVAQTAYFDDIVVSSRPVTTPANEAPLVSLSAVADRAQAPGKVTLTATVSDVENGPLDVTLKRDVVLASRLGVGSGTYTYTDNALAAGTYTYEVNVTDTVTGYTTTERRTVIINAAPNAMPSFTSFAVTPAKATAPATVTLKAQVSDADGAADIVRVDFYRQGNDTALATDTSADTDGNYTHTVSSLAAGSYTYYAKVFDKAAATAISANSTVTVSAPPPPNAAPRITSFTANPTNTTAPATVTLTAQASDADGAADIARVEFYRQGNDTALASDTSADSSGNYTHTLSNLAAGSYTYYARVVDKAATAATSANVTVTVTVPDANNQAPTSATITGGIPRSGILKKIEAPEDTSKLPFGFAPATLTITAAISDPDNNIRRLQAYANGKPLGAAVQVSGNSPYTLTLPDLAAGIYQLRVVATDAGNATVTSNEIVIPVLAADPEPMSDWQARISGSVGEIYRVNLNAELNSRLASARAGDVIIVANGTYDNWNIRMETRGTASAPILIVPESRHGVTFRGTGTHFRWSRAEHVWLAGFRFEDVGAVAFEFRRAHNNRMTDNICMECGGAIANRIVYLADGASKNRIDHNVFIRPRSFSIVGLIVRGEALISENRVDHNVFRHDAKNPGASDGRIPLQFGQGSSPSLSGGRTSTVIEYNFFEDYFEQVINSKSSGDIMRYNIVYNSIHVDDAEGISVRMGRDKLIEGNLLINRMDAMGIRGSNHRVINNIIIGSKRYNIAITDGTASNDCNPVNSYGVKHDEEKYKDSCWSAARNTLIAYNSIFTARSSEARSGTAIHVGQDRSDNDKVPVQIPPKGIWIVGNYLSAHGGNDDLVVVDTTTDSTRPNDAVTDFYIGYNLYDTRHGGRAGRTGIAPVLVNANTAGTRLGIAPEVYQDKGIKLGDVPPLFNPMPADYKPYSTTLEDFRPKLREDTTKPDIGAWESSVP